MTSIFYLEGGVGTFLSTFTPPKTNADSTSNGNIFKDLLELLICTGKVEGMSEMLVLGCRTSTWDLMSSL